jgi:hypothetical protein
MMAQFQLHILGNMNGFLILHVIVVRRLAGVPETVDAFFSNQGFDGEIPDSRRLLKAATDGCRKLHDP